MVDATGLGVDLRWEYPWSFAAKAGALYLASFGLSAAFPPFELPPDTNGQKEIPSTAELIDMTGTKQEAASSKMCGEELAIPHTPEPLGGPLDWE
jgi:hypothetical protein